MGPHPPGGCFLWLQECCTLKTCSYQYIVFGHMGWTFFFIFYIYKRSIWTNTILKFTELLVTILWKSGHLCTLWGKLMLTVVRSIFISMQPINRLRRIQGQSLLLSVESLCSFEEIWASIFEKFTFLNVLQHMILSLFFKEWLYTFIAILLSCAGQPTYPQVS